MDRIKKFLSILVISLVATGCSKTENTQVNNSQKDDVSSITISNDQDFEERMKELRVMDYCVLDNWIYYVTLGDEEGFHKMALDGNQDINICDFSNVTYPISGSTSVISELQEEYILYKFQTRRQYDENGKLEPPHPIGYYKLNLSNNTLESMNGEE